MHSVLKYRRNLHTNRQLTHRNRDQRQECLEKFITGIKSFGNRNSEGSHGESHATCAFPKILVVRYKTVFYSAWLAIPIGRLEEGHFMLW